MVENKKYGSCIYILTSVYLVILNSQAVSCGEVTATSINNEEPEFNSTVIMIWKVTPGDDEFINSLNLLVLPDSRNPVLIGSDRLPLELRGVTLFGERLSGTYNKTGEHKYVVTLNNIQYDENYTFQLKAIFGGNGLAVKSADIMIKNVVGSPGICGNNLKSAYNLIETASLTVTQDICGYPQPIVEWKLEEDKTFSGSLSSVLKNNASRKYRYTFTTRQMVRSYCGKKIIYNAKNEFGNVEGNSTIYISFKPSKITLRSSYRYNASCVYLAWYREDTGNCLMEYHLKFDDKNDVYSTFNTIFNLCHSPCSSSASVWASYKGNAGYKNSFTLRSIPSRPDTTIMPTYRTTTEGKTAQSVDDCKCASQLAIGIVITIVIGLIINIVIFVILKHKGFIVFNKNSIKTLQNTERRDDDNYEVTQTTSSHYADLDVKSVKPSIYADLTKVSDSSKEYAEIELSETKPNVYANIDT